jgi:NADH dehydrogenase
MYMKKKVVIVGAGFAGIQLARNLDESLFDVLIIDKLNHHQFQPLFYQVATSQIEPSSISFPIRFIFRKKKNLQVRLAEVQNIHPDKNSIDTSIGEFTYDYLVIAIGCTTNFFGNANLAEHAFTLKSTYEAIEIRNHILNVFENIVTATDQERAALMNLCIVGGGPTGVELGGSFAEMKTNILPNDYPGIDFSRFNVYLIDNSKLPLSNMSESSSKWSKKYLIELGVNVKNETLVKDYDGNSLTLASGEIIPTKTVIWAAGVIANTINGLPEVALNKSRRLNVNRYNLVAGCNNIYALGDVCRMETPLYPNGHPQVANVAINQAKLLAKNLKALERNKSLAEYEYKDLGSMATIGTNKAVVDIGKIHLKGYFAWLIWMFLHLMLILSVKKKLIIFINWAWAYVTKNSSLRLILKDPNDIKKTNKNVP